MGSSAEVGGYAVVNPTILCGDWIECLKTLPDESVHCVVTSPPYWGLRDYGTGKWDGGNPECDHQVNSGGASQLQGASQRGRSDVCKGDCPKCGAVRIDRQLGLERTPEEYVSKMVEGFREVRRVLRSDGTCWVNLGDSYSGGGNYRGIDSESTLTNKQRSNRGARGLSQLLGSSGKETGCKPKDLVGIPWMVAFALRAPYEHSVIRNRIDRAWLAALIDGEGCMTIMRAENGKGSAESYPPVLQVKMCDPECIQKANEVTGFNQCLRQDPPSHGGVRTTYQWRISSNRAADIAAEIYPYLLIKRKQAVILWNHQQVRDSYETKRGVPMPEEAREKQKQCRELIQALNQREQVDLPSWMKEPSIRIEPGWYLRQDCIWSKPNPMPESVTDRCTKAHEYVFLLTKAARYYFDAEAIKEESIYTGTVNSFGNKDADARLVNKLSGNMIPGVKYETLPTRNKRSVWDIPTSPFPEAHFATFPPDLVRPCILAGTSEKGCCGKCGAPWERITERGEPIKQHWAPGTQEKIDIAQGRHGSTSVMNTGFTTQIITTGWQPTCSCNADPVKCTVLDPFWGSGTTGEVAIREGCNAIGIELKPEYIEMSLRSRFAQKVLL